MLKETPSLGEISPIRSSKSPSSRNKILAKSLSRKPEGNNLEDLKSLIDKCLNRKSKPVPEQLKKPVKKRCNSEIKFSQRNPEILKDHEFFPSLYKKKERSITPLFLVSNNEASTQIFISTPVKLTRNRPRMKLSTPKHFSSKKIELRPFQVQKVELQSISLLGSKKISLTNKIHNSKKSGIIKFPKPIEIPDSNNSDSLDSFDDRLSPSYVK